MNRGHHGPSNGNTYYSQEHHIDVVGSSTDPNNAYLQNSYGGNVVYEPSPNDGAYVQNSFNLFPMQQSATRPPEQLMPVPNSHYSSAIHPNTSSGLRNTEAVRARPQPGQLKGAAGTAHQWIERTTPPQSNPMYSPNGVMFVADPSIDPLTAPSLHAPSSATLSHPSSAQGILLHSYPHYVPNVGAPNSLASVEAMRYAQEWFPEGTPGYMEKRAEMYNVLMSGWKQNNQFEPSPDALLKFATRTNGNWECAFYIEGRRCQRSSTERQRQIIEHIRRHIKLEPYACEGLPCPSSQNGCGRRYSSGDPLRKHRDGNLKGESTCELCGRILLPGNVIRHRLNSCRGSGH